MRNFLQLSTVQSLLLFALLLPLMIFLYAPSFSGGFYLDSKPYVLESHFYQGNISLHEAVSRVLEKGYHPASRRIIPNITMAFQTHSEGPSTSRLRAFNVIVHTANISLLFLLLKFLTSLLISGAEPKFIAGISAAAALLWGLNPFQVETVAYIVQRSVLLASFFYFLGGIIFLSIITRAKSEKVLWMWPALISVLLFAALCKENTLQFTITFLMVYFYIEPLERVRTSKKGVILPLAATGLLMLFIMILARGMGGNPLSNYSTTGFTAVERLLTESRVLLHQLSLFVFPLPGRLSLTPHYDLSRSLSVPPSTIISVLLFLLLLASIIVYRKRFPAWGLAVIWFFSNHLIESTIIPLEIAFPHRSYLPSALIFLVPLLLLGYPFTQKLDAGKKYIQLGSGGALILAVLMAFGTYQHNRTWGDETRFWLHNISASPGSTMPYISLSGFLLENRKSKSALKVIERGLTSGDFDNDRPERKGNMLINKGLALSNLGKKGEGIYWVGEALKLQPENINYQYNLAALLMQSHRYNEAEKILKDILQSDDTYPDANLQLALIYENRGQLDAALELVKRELYLFPGKKSAATIYRRLFQKSVNNKPMS